MGFAERNWAGNIAFGAARFHEPRSVDEVQSVVAAATKVRAIGGRHSFNTIADTEGDQLSLSALARLIEIDNEALTVTIDGGITYAELAPYLHEHGMALANLASLPHISVAGACATATHGSGVANGNLATAVVAMQFVTAGGDLVEISRDRDPHLMDALTVGLGAAGIVTRLTLAIEPTFDVRQTVYEHLPMPTTAGQFDEVMADGYSVSLFTTWRGGDIEQFWRKVRFETDDDRTQPDAGLARFGASPATRKLHPIAELPSGPCTDQLGVAGPWYERLPHFRIGFTPSSGDELQSELFVAKDEALEAVAILRSIGASLAPVLQISEVRTVAADSMWLSPCHQQQSVAFHFTWIPSWLQVEPVLAALESALAPLLPRPHWGKLTTITGPVLQTRFERLEAFGELISEWDPTGKFRNAYLDAILP
ncbi:MAG: FAD-binding protein [Ilumatobacteraceae bacterium]